MPKNYYCKPCDYSSNLVANFKRHCKSKRHLHKIEASSICNPTSSICNPTSSICNPTTSNYICPYCKKAFKYRQTLHKHKTKVCKFKNVNEEQPVITEMKKEINDLKQQLSIHVGNIQNNIIGQQNVFILNHKDTDYEFLTDNDYLKCISDNNHCVKKLIETVHFNPNKPENMNIYISSIKGKYILVYRDDTWQIHDKNKEIDNLYEMNEISLENWYDENKERYPNRVKSFERYLKNKDDDNTLIRNVKDEILLMLYNKHKVLQET